MAGRQTDDVNVGTADGDTNVTRNEFNDALRQWVVANDKVLFDIADIEAHDPDGNPITFVHTDGLTYHTN